MRAKDPYRGFRFRVIFDQERAGFSRVKGLARETKYESFREGGVNDYEHKLATVTTYGPLILERGLVDPWLWTWHDEVIRGHIVRSAVTVELRDDADQVVWRWLIDGAFPVKWTGADLDASNAQLVVESVELAHHGIRRG